MRMLFHLIAKRKPLGNILELQSMLGRFLYPMNKKVIFLIGYLKFSLFSLNEVFNQLVLKYLSALFLPGFMVVFFTRVAYNHILALVLTVALIAASVYKGYTDSFLLIVVDAFSLTVGFYFANRMMKRNKKQS